jgi:hypothetical protein
MPRAGNEDFACKELEVIGHGEMGRLRIELAFLEKFAP